MNNDLNKWLNMGQQQPQYRQEFTGAGFRAIGQPQKPKGNQLLKTGLSIAGGTLGTVLGTIAAPGLGTAAGGALGSGLGTLIGRRIGGESVTSGEALGEVGLDALLGGLFSGFGKAAKAAKLGQSAVKIGGKEVGRQSLASALEGVGVASGKKGVQQSLQAATRAAQQQAPRNIFEKLATGGQRIAQKEIGLAEGVKLGGKVVSPKELNALYNFIRKDLGVTIAESSKPGMILRKAETYQTALRGELDNILSGSKKVFTNVDATDVLNAAKKGYLPGTNVASKSVQRLEQDAAKAITNGTPATLNSFKNSLDKIINYSATNVTPEKQQVASALRQAIDGKISAAVPNTKPILGKLSNVFKVNELVGAAGRKEAGNIGGAIDLAQRVTRATGARVGGAPQLQAALTAAGEKAAKPLTLKSILTRQGIAGGIGGAVAGGGQPAQPGMEGMTDNEITNQMVASGQLPASQAEMFGQGGMGTGMGAEQAAADEQAQIDQYFQGLALQDLQQTGGKRLSAIKAAYDLFGGGKASKPSAAEVKAQQQLAGVQTGVDRIARLYSQTGAQGRIGGLVGEAGAALGLNEAAQNYNNQREALLAPLARAISGEVGVLTDRDIKRADRLLPKLTDNPNEARAKLQELYLTIGQRQNINRQVFSRGVTGGSSLGDVLYNFPE